MPIRSAFPNRCQVGVLVIAAALLPTAAAAHSPFPGIKGFYTGLLHPLTSPAQILSLIALGLIFGQRWPGRFRLAWLVFAGTCLAGILFGQTGMSLLPAEPSLLASAFLIAVLAALWPDSPAALCVAAAGIVGLLLGLISTPDPGPLRPTIITLAGSLAGATVSLLYAAAGLGWLKEKTPPTWSQIGFRIAAAWLAAITVLLLALSLVNPR